MTDRRNILFIVIDQLRADCLSGALADHVDLPHLRALMDDAVSFSAHYSVTNPCGPSRASLLTGQYAMNHRSVRNGTPLPHDKPNIAKALRAEGYLPLLYGYTDTSNDPRQFDARDPVLQTYEEVMPGFYQVVEMKQEESWGWRARLRAKGLPTPPYPEIFAQVGDRLDDPPLYPAEDSDTAYLTDSFIEDILGRPQGWFAHLTYVRPHYPMCAPAPYNRMYDPGALPPPVTACDLQAERARHPFNGGAMDRHPVSSMVAGFPDLEPTDEVVATLRAVYLGLATEVDHHIGRIIAALKANGLYEDTLLVVSSDHGDMLGDHHLWDKQTYYDAAYHIPLIVRDARAGGPRGRVVAQPTESVDVAPTILDCVGADIPDGFDGRSLAPFLAGGTPEGWRDYTYSELDFGNPVTPTPQQKQMQLQADEANLAIIRTGRYRYVHFAADLPPLLFDMEAEGEAKNIADDAAAMPILLDLSRVMLSHRMRHAEGTFSRTMITSRGPVRGSGAAQ